MTARFALGDASQPLVIDFAPGAANVKGVTRERRGGDRGVPAGPHRAAGGGAEAGRHRGATIEFTAGDASLNRNDDFLYTLFVPARAHLAIPCFDQPDLKARWTLALDVPGRVAGGQQRRAEQRRQIALSTAPRRAAARSRLGSPRPQPISDLPVLVRRRRLQGRDGRAQRPHLPHVPPRDRRREGGAQPRRDLRPARRARSRWLEDYTGIPYSVRQVRLRADPVVPVRRHGALRARSSTTPPACCSTSRRRRTSTSAAPVVIAHETAHMWFGDLVTMRWFNDVWMKEVFANFMAAKIVNPSFPEVNHDLRFLLRALPGRLRRRSHRRHQPDPPAARQPERGRQRSTARSSTRRRRSSCGSSSALLGADVVPRRPARVPERARVRQRDLARPDRRARRADARGPGGVEPRLGRGARPADDHDRARGRRTARIAPAGLRAGAIRAAAASSGRSSCASSIGAARRRRARSTSALNGAARRRCPRRSAGRRRASCCRTAAAGLRRLRARSDVARATSPRAVGASPIR